HSHQHVHARVEPPPGAVRQPDDALEPGPRLLHQPGPARRLRARGLRERQASRRLTGGDPAALSFRRGRREPLGEIAMVRHRLHNTVTLGRFNDALQWARDINAVCKKRGWTEFSVMVPSFGVVNQFILEAEYPDHAAFFRENEAFQ